jgi:hypothetical protein
LPQNEGGGNIVYLALNSQDSATVPRGEGIVAKNSDGHRRHEDAEVEALTHPPEARHHRTQRPQDQARRRAPRSRRRLARWQPGFLPRERHHVHVRCPQLALLEDDQEGRRWPLARPRGRHTAVSIMSSNGVSIQEISDTVGHKSTHVTETVYRHVIVPAIRGGATVMDDVFGDTDLVKNKRQAKASCQLHLG